jgi:chloramphenicol-sensitive protein RarD
MGGSRAGRVLLDSKPQAPAGLFMNKGVWHAVAAYALWGLLPVYWKWLHAVPALPLIAHRVVWSFLGLALVLGFSGQLGALRPSRLSRRTLGTYLVSALLIGANWLIYVWAVNAGFIVETSLGYFINPLLSVLLGVLVFRERLRRLQWVAVAIAAAGVCQLTFAYGRLPWIALALAGTFAGYGLIKKTAPLGPLIGLAIETGLLVAPALIVLGWSEARGTGPLTHGDPATLALLVGAGVVTTVPFVLFSSAAQRIPLSLIGILQYTAPTLQFLIGVFLYREPFTRVQFAGFALVWIALAIFAIEGMAVRQKCRAAP